jgi:3-isopropylmalate/(R)-2-methylmalate dehydratase large subunit
LGKTIVEKIMSAHSGSDVHAGDIAICDVQFVMAGHESNVSLTVNSYQDLCQQEQSAVFDPKRIAYFLDHVVPSQNEGFSNLQQMVRTFSKDHNIRLMELGYGICHQVLAEDRLIFPGEIVVGADSHTCTNGALNLFATGLGSTDIAVSMKTGKQWFKVPATSRIVLDGKLPTGSYSKDIILYLLGRFSSSGFIYQCIEFAGEAISALSVEQRLTISNMAVELGAKAGIMEFDDKLRDWYGKCNDRSWQPVFTDEGARYEQVVHINAEEIIPQVAHSHSLDNVSPVGDMKDVAIHQAVLGTCTNGRLEDLEVAAGILKGNKIDRNVRMLIYPASTKTLLEATRKNIVEQLLEAGTLICPPGCGPCSGLYGGVPADDENVVSTSNRNFRGRMGNRNANVYIASPATVAASALTGHLTDPRDL